MISPHAHHESRSSGPKPRAALNFNTLDLNLLRVFDALDEERSVTRAGLRLGVTQSAVSHSLTRLRDLLGDELFIRGAEGMMPTAWARALAPRLRSALAQVETALLETAFEPLRSEHRFTLAMDPYVRAILLPQAIARIRMEAPSIELRIKQGSAGATDALDSGQLDLAVASYRRIPERFGMQDLFQERHVWALRDDHPAAEETLTLEGLAHLPHLVRVLTDDEDANDPAPELGRGLVRRAIQDDDGALSHALAGIGRQRSVRLTIPDSFAALAIVGKTDLAALVPWRMGRALAAPLRLRLFEPPYASPSIPITMVWHQSHGANAANEWLRRIFMEVAAGV